MAVYHAYFLHVSQRLFPGDGKGVFSGQRDL